MLDLVLKYGGLTEVVGDEKTLDGGRNLSVLRPQLSISATTG